MATSVQLRIAPARNYIGGRFVDGDLPSIDVHDPSTGEVISRVPMSAGAEVDAAVKAARRARDGWAATPIKERVQVFYRYKSLLERHIDERSEEHTSELQSRL